MNATATPKKSRKKAPAEPAGEPAQKPEGRLVFTRKGMVKEYHETETTRQLSGCRIVAVCNIPLAEMPLGEDRSHASRTRYGKLVITFPTVTDEKPDVDRITIPGRLELTKLFPTKKAEAGRWTLTLSASEVVAQPVIDRLIELKRSSMEVELSFHGAFEQQVLEGMTEPQNLG